MGVAAASERVFDLGVDWMEGATQRSADGLDDAREPVDRSDGAVVMVEVEIDGREEEVHRYGTQEPGDDVSTILGRREMAEAPGGAGEEARRGAPEWPAGAGGSAADRGAAGGVPGDRCGERAAAEAEEVRIDFAVGCDTCDDRPRCDRCERPLQLGYGRCCAPPRFIPGPYRAGYIWHFDSEAEFDDFLKAHLHPTWWTLRTSWPPA